MEVKIYFDSVRLSNPFTNIVFPAGILIAGAILMSAAVVLCSFSGHPHPRDNFSFEPPSGPEPTQSPGQSPAWEKASVLQWRR
ncbi:hypothetical protein ACFX13_007362 [Malus domestica]